METKRMQNIKLFNPSNLVIEPLLSRIEYPDIILKEMGEERNSRLKDILQRQEINKDSITQIHSFSKIHELKSSTKEFVALQKFTNSNSSGDYISDKKYLKDSLNRMKQSVSK